MSDPTEDPPPVTEADPAPTAALLQPPKVRTEAQRQALERARQKAMAARAEASALRQKEKEVERALLDKAKRDRAAKIEADYAALSTPTVREEEDEAGEVAEEEQVAEAPRKRKPARRVVHVTEVSSASESETEEVEVRLPKPRREKKSAEQIAYERSVQKLFHFE